MEWRGRPTLSLTSALNGDGWLTPRPGHVIRGKETRYPTGRRLGGPLGRSGRVWDTLPQPGFDSRTVHRVASRCTDCASVTVLIPEFYNGV